MLSKFLQYLELELNRSRLTVAAYGRDLRELGAYLELDPELPAPQYITTSDLRSWLADMSRRGISGRTLRRKTQAARAFFRFVQKLGMIKVNPASDIQLARTGRKLPEFVREQEMERLLSTPPVGGDPALKIRNRLAITLIYSSGIRREELGKITDADIDFDSKELRVHGKRDKMRIVPLADELLCQIREWQSVRDTMWELPRPAPLICSAHGRLTGRAIYNLIHDQLMTTNATHKGPHTLRHTFATSMLNGGAEINSVRELLGHSSLQSTQIYTHLTFSDIRKAYNSAHPRAEKEK